MRKPISRRDFIRHGTGFGAAAIGGKWLHGLGRNAGREESPLIAVCSGEDALLNTQKAVELAGGIGRFVPSGSKVALLPNSQSRHLGTFTHPDVIRATVRMCRDAGAVEIVALSWLPERFWQASGLDKVLKEEGAGLEISGREDDFFKEVPVPEGRILKTAWIIKTLDEYDVLINMPIIKDHAGNLFTGTMKNLMGLNSPSSNRTFHLENWETDPEDLAHLDQCIADLNMVVPAHLCVVDAMEIITTNGPFGPGKLAHPKMVVAGTDRVAIDAYCTRYLGLEPKDIIMIRRGADHGLGQMDVSKIRIREARV